tara:strand:+ start:5195 stop:6493 length:1299 start_codon:yes stop_codon:yes gene_type:complete
MNITVIGTGYVGLVTGTCLSDYGNKVRCIDVDKDKIKSLNKGVVTIYEPGLEKIFKKNLNNGNLFFRDKLDDSINDSDLIFLALPTPSNEDGSADLKYVIEVAEKLSTIINSYKIIINKSTVPVGTTKKVSDIFKRNSEIDIDVISNPEFLREGVAVKDFMNPKRIIIGSKSEKAKNVMNKLYKPFTNKGSKIYFMNEESSELTKYAANSFLATKISFMNEISQICEISPANIEDIKLGLGSDSRIGKRFLNAGIGYGGSCLPKDVKALISFSDKINYDFKILKSVEKINELQKVHIISKIQKFFNNDIEGKHFGIWGLAFKPATDDIREAPSLEIIKNLLELNSEITAYDPVASSPVKKILGNKISYSSEPYEMLDKIDALIICTEWDEFKNINIQKLQTKLQSKTIFDGRNIFDPKIMSIKGFKYISIGR